MHAPDDGGGGASDDVLSGDPVFEAARENKNILLPFGFTNSDGGSERAMHPVALAFEQDGRPFELSSRRQLNSEDRVLVRIPGIDTPTWVSFDTYLDMFGSNYHDYYRLLKRREARPVGKAANDSVREQQALLFDVHRAAIQRRTNDVKRLRSRYERVRPTAEDFQQETRAHSETFRKLFDDLNIPGISSASARRRNDYEDTIDDFILLDPEALMTGEEATAESEDPDYDRYLHIGVQRTFGSQSASQDAFESDQAKQKKIEEKPLYWIPEHLEWGPVARFYLRERFEDYGIEGRGGAPNYTEQLYALRAKQSREQGVAANSLELPPLYRVLGKTASEGKEAQHLWAYQVLQKMLKKFETQVNGDMPVEQKAVMERYVQAVGLALNRVGEQLQHLREQREAKERKAS